MKKGKSDSGSKMILAVLVLALAACIFLALNCPSKGGAIADGCPAVVGCGAAAKCGGAIVEDRIVVPKKAGDYSTVRYIKLKGTDYEIGKALGELAQDEYQVALSAYDDPSYGAKRKEYMAAHFPALLERMRGVAAAYGEDFSDNSNDYSGLPIDAYLPLCSAFYLPGGDTASGHAKVARNLDFSATLKSAQFNVPSRSGESNMLSQIVVYEMHPDSGYSYLAMGGFDVLNPMSEGVNEKGLYVGLFGNVGSHNVTQAAYGGRSAGLSVSQMLNLVLGSCASLEEVQRKIEGNSVYVPIFDVHLLAADAQGNAMVWDRDDSGGPGRFTYNRKGQPQVITNHPVSPGYDTGTFPVDPSFPSYSSVARYDTLTSAIANHTGKFTDQDMWDTIGSVYPRGSSFGTHGLRAAEPVPFRPVWSSVWDLDVKSVDLKFYQHDIPAANASEPPELAMTGIYSFTLSKE